MLPNRTICLAQILARTALFDADGWIMMLLDLLPSRKTNKKPSIHNTVDRPPLGWRDWRWRRRSRSYSAIIVSCSVGTEEASAEALMQHIPWVDATYLSLCFDYGPSTPLRRSIMVGTTGARALS